MNIYVQVFVTIGFKFSWVCTYTHMYTQTHVCVGLSCWIIWQLLEEFSLFLLKLILQNIDCDLDLKVKWANSLSTFSYPHRSTLDRGPALLICRLSGSAEQVHPDQCLQTPDVGPELALPSNQVTYLFDEEWPKSLGVFREVIPHRNQGLERSVLF